MAFIIWLLECCELPTPCLYTLLPLQPFNQYLYLNWLFKRGFLKKVFDKYVVTSQWFTVCLCANCTPFGSTRIVHFVCQSFLPVTIPISLKHWDSHFLCVCSWVRYDAKGLPASFPYPWTAFKKQMMVVKIHMKGILFSQPLTHILIHGGD